MRFKGCDAGEGGEEVGVGYWVVDDCGAL